MMLQSAGVDYLFLPNEKEMYSDGFVSFVEVEKITGVLEGKFRPTHFRGVATVVAKLFNITKPHCAVFGQKDAQQVAVIRQMVKDLNFDVELIVAPIVREPDGLAMSSRNIYLSADERKQSLVLSESLELAQRLVARGERNPATVIKKMTDLISSKPAARVDYVSIADPSTLQECRVIGNGDVVLVSLAVHFGRTRLIDNKLVTA
jgi:pantoate--beta-alanine ligase